jgi:hypothetical protein
LPADAACLSLWRLGRHFSCSNMIFELSYGWSFYPSASSPRAGAANSIPPARLTVACSTVTSKHTGIAMSLAGYRASPTSVTLGPAAPAAGDPVRSSAPVLPFCRIAGGLEPPEPAAGKPHSPRQFPVFAQVFPPERSLPGECHPLPGRAVTEGHSSINAGLMGDRGSGRCGKETRSRAGSRALMPRARSARCSRYP